MPLRVRESVWWPGVSRQIEQWVQQCPVCIQAARLQTARLQTEPLKLTDYPWQVAWSDLFELDGKYLLLVDYYSRFPEVIKLNTMTSSAVIRVLQAAFSIYGIPEMLQSDIGPQYASQELQSLQENTHFSTSQAPLDTRRVMGKRSVSSRQ